MKISTAPPSAGSNEVFTSNTYFMSNTVSLLWTGQEDTRIRLEPNGPKVDLGSLEIEQVDRVLADQYVRGDKRFKIVNSKKEAELITEEVKAIWEEKKNAQKEIEKAAKKAEKETAKVQKENKKADDDDDIDIPDDLEEEKAATEKTDVDVEDDDLPVSKSKAKK